MLTFWSRGVPKAGLTVWVSHTGLGNWVAGHSWENMPRNNMSPDQQVEQG